MSWLSFIAGFCLGGLVVLLVCLRVLGGSFYPFRA